MAARKWKIGDAKREGLPVLIGVAGPSGSGKTYTALRLGVGVQRIVGGDLALLDTEGGRALEYADRFKFKHVPFEAPFNALAYLDALKWIEAQGVKTCIVDSMSHEHEGDGGHLAMHEAEVERMISNGWGSREKAGFAAWAKPAAERRALVLYLQQRRMNLILCFRAKDKLVLMKNSKGKQEPTSIGWQPIAGEDYAYEMKAIAVLPPRSKGVPDWSEGAQAAKINAGMENLFPPPGKPLDEETGERFAKWAAGETGTRGRPLNDPKPKPAGHDEAPPPEDETPAFVPDGGWPQFQSTGKWATWSVKEFLPNADSRMAQAWLDWWSRDWLRIQDAAREGNESAGRATKDIDAALKAAMKRAPK